MPRPRRRKARRMEAVELPSRTALHFRTSVGATLHTFQLQVRCSRSHRYFPSRLHSSGQLVGTSSEICFETLSSSLWFRCVPRFFSQLLPFRYSVRSCLWLASRADACAGGCAVGCARERSSHCETSAASCCRTTYESVNLSIKKK